eukprot:COSAG02_NODE_1888_length_10500_cov_3.026536_7_plen_174_part_00
MLIHILRLPFSLHLCSLVEARAEVWTKAGSRWWCGGTGPAAVTTRLSKPWDTCRRTQLTCQFGKFHRKDGNDRPLHLAPTVTKRGDSRSSGNPAYQARIEILRLLRPRQSHTIVRQLTYSVSAPLCWRSCTPALILRNFLLCCCRHCPCNSLLSITNAKTIEQGLCDQLISSP